MWIYLRKRTDSKLIIQSRGNVVNLKNTNDYFAPEIMSDKHVALAVMFDVPAGEDYRFDQIVDVDVQYDINLPFSKTPDPNITNDQKSVVPRAQSAVREIKLCIHHH